MHYGLTSKESLLYLTFLLSRRDVVIPPPLGLLVFPWYFTSIPTFNILTFLSVHLTPIWVIGHDGNILKHGLILQDVCACLSIGTYTLGLAYQGTGGGELDHNVTTRKHSMFAEGRITKNICV